MSDHTTCPVATSSRRNAGAFVAVLTVLAVLLSPGGASAAPPTAPLTTDPADGAAGWLTGEFADGNHLTTSFDLNGDGEIDPITEVFPDYGLTADAVLAFAAAGSAGEAANAATDYLEANITPYAGDGAAESYAGSLAKLILVAVVMQRDPTDFGGRDLVADLRAREQPSGRYADLSAFGDFSNGFSQSLAVLSLLRGSPTGPSATAVDYLVAQQCADGGFNSVLESLPCEGEVDTSAFAIQALAQAGRVGPLAAAVTFLVGAQAADGSFSAPGFGSPPVFTANSNSTGLATQALRVVGKDSAADHGRAWLLDRQVAADGPQAQQGAFAFDASGFDPATATRATTQAILGVSGVGFSDLVAPSDPLAYGLDVGAGSVLPPPPVVGPPVVAPPPPQLPATGADPLPAIALGLALLGVGTATLALSRRRSNP